jgi:heat shock protein HslJ/phosphoglycolate phosphatase-like HAD superfamily hydrolase
MDRGSRRALRRRGESIVAREARLLPALKQSEVRPMMRRFVLTLALCVTFGSWGAQSDPLPSWNDGASRKAIIDFISKVTTEGSPDFVKPAERIAVFDNDGTLWAEQPAYFQLVFMIDRVKAMAAERGHPEWQTTEPFKSAIAGDMKGVMATGKEGLAKIGAVTHTNMTADEFAESVRDWLASAKHPKTGMPYNQMIYQPMLELLEYLRANEFKTFIVSGGGIDFMRVFAEETYGIPPEQVVGSSVAAKFEMRDGVPTIVKQPQDLFVDDKEGKPVGIYQHIGRRPNFAAGNSDGDLQMLQYTTIERSSGDVTPRFGLIVHHDDAKREWAYDRDSHIGTLDKALDEAAQRGWTVVSMKDDWRRIFPDEQATSAGGGALQLEDTKWSLFELNGQPATDSLHGTGAHITLASKDGSVVGNTSINNLRGRYTLSGDRLTFMPGAMTRMAGPEPLMKQEQAFLEALTAVKSWRIAGDTLELLDGETVLARFRAASAP